MCNYTWENEVLKVSNSVHTYYMRLLIATGVYAPEVGGPATYTAFLESYLPKYGIDFVVVPFSRVRKIPKILRHLWYTMLLMRTARRGDVLYALDTVSVGFSVMIVSFILRKSYIVRVPGDYAWEQGTVRYGVSSTLDEFQTQRSLPWQVRLMMWIQQRVVRHAAWVLVPSEYMKSIVQKWNVAPERIVRIYSALRTESILESKEVLREKYGYNGYTIVSSGRLVPWKGMDGLIQATHALRLQNIPVTLRIIGDGVCMLALQNRIHTLGAEAYIFLEGKETHQKTLEKIKAADLFVLNTGYEGLSHQLIEVMSLGVPIITTAVGGNTELIESRKTGILIPYNDLSVLEKEIRYMYEHCEEAEKYARNAKENVASFSEDRIIKTFIEFVQEKLCT